MASSPETTKLPAIAAIEGVGNPEEWAVVQTNVITGPDDQELIKGRKALDVAGETTELFATIHQLGRVILGDAVMPDSTGHSTISRSRRYVTHANPSVSE